MHQGFRELMRMPSTQYQIGKLSFAMFKPVIDALNIMVHFCHNAKYKTIRSQPRYYAKDSCLSGDVLTSGHI